MGCASSKPKEVDDLDEQYEAIVTSEQDTLTGAPVFEGGDQNGGDTEEAEEAAEYEEPPGPAPGLEHGRAAYHGSSNYGPADNSPSAATDDNYGPAIPSSDADGGIPYMPVYGDPSQENRDDTTQMDIVTLDPADSSVGIGLEVAADDDGSKTSVIRVVEMLPDGAADLSTEVRLGDRLVAINSVRVNSSNLKNVERVLQQSTEKVELLLEHGKTFARRMSAKRVIQEEVYENVEQEVPEAEAPPPADPATTIPEIRVKWGTRTVTIVVQGEEEDCSIWYTTDGTDPEEKDELLWDDTKTLEIPEQASFPGEVYMVHAIAQVKSGEKKMSKQANFARALDSEAELPAPKISFNHTLQRVEIDTMFAGATAYFSHTEMPVVSEELEVTGGTAYDPETPVKPESSPGDNDIWAVSVMAGMKTSKTTRHTYEVMQAPPPKVWHDTATLTLNTKDENPHAVIFYDWGGGTHDCNEPERPLDCRG